MIIFTKTFANLTAAREIIIGFTVELDGSLNHFEIIKALTKRWIWQL
jgi:hypothetical protein